MHLEPVYLKITINASAPIIFATIIDLPAYSTWLEESGVFKGTTEVSDVPVREGTTYIETGPAGVRYGTVTELQEPSKVTFAQPMTLKPVFLGLIIGVRVRMTINEEEGGGSLLERTVDLDLPWILWPFQSIIREMFRKESQRTMDKLKVWIEKKVNTGAEGVSVEHSEGI
ncbi:hypothetical protein B7463_g9388, partial [Scytalidium lignicola]